MGAPPIEPLPEPLQSTMRLSMEKDPAARFQHVSELAATLLAEPPEAKSATEGLPAPTAAIPSPAITTPIAPPPQTGGASGGRRPQQWHSAHC